jgi:hypothetical protein
MAEQKVGSVYVEISAQLDKLRADLDRARAEAVSAGADIGNSINQRVAASIGDGGTERILRGTNTAATGFSGQLGRAFESAKGVSRVLGGVIGLASRLNLVVGGTVLLFKGMYESVAARVDKERESLRANLEIAEAFRQTLRDDKERTLEA